MGGPAPDGGLPDLGDSMDPVTFSQILEMDEDEEEKEFSKSIVYGFFEQALTTFDNMEEKIEEKNLKDLSSLGHFLKGSSAIIGLTHIKQSCERIQHWGNEKDETGQEALPPGDCLKAIRSELFKMRQEYSHVERVLKKFYGET